MIKRLRKPRTWGFLAGVCGVLVVGMAGLTGLLLRQQLAPLQTRPLVLDNGARLGVEALHAGWFATRVNLRLAWPLDTERQLVLHLANDIGHGPLPWVRLANLQLLPVALADRLRLLSLEVLQGERSQALPAQFAGNLYVSYLGRLQAVLNADLQKVPLGSWQLAVEGLQLKAEGTMQALQLQLQAQGIQLQPDLPVAPVTVALQALHINLQAAQLSTYPQGRLALSVEQVDVRQGGAALLELTELNQHVRLHSDEAGAALTLQASAQALALWGQTVGPLSQALTAEGVGLTALLQAMGGQAQAWAAALPPASRVQGAVLALESADGRSQLSLEKTKGQQPLHVSVNLSKPMFVAALESNAALRLQGQRIARQQALQLYGFVSQPLLQTGLFLSGEQGLQAELALDADGLRSTLPTTFLSQHP